MGKLSETVLTRRQIEAKIAAGDVLVIFDRNVLKVNSWLKFHPGGDKAILHMVGRDATDEINWYGTFYFFCAQTFRFLPAPPSPNGTEK